MVTQFLIKLKLPRYVKTSSIMKQKQSPKTSCILKEMEYYILNHWTDQFTLVFGSFDSMAHYN